MIDGDPGELAALYQDFLIRVTEFFRDPDSFEALRRFVFPAVCEGRSGKRSLRIWVPGCATGEEVYSVAIALLEYLGDSVPAARIQIFGTDVSETALQQARAGVYAAHALHDVSSERLQRFFTKQNGEYRVAKQVRDLCLFARQDVTRDPPFSRLDLISCRNLLIYLDGVAQQRVLRTFHYALRPEGMLMFGPAESVGPSSDLFEQVDKRFRVYRRLPTPIMAVPACRSFTASDASTLTSEKKDMTLDVDTQLDAARSGSTAAGTFCASECRRQPRVDHPAVSRPHRPVSRARRRRPQLRSAARRTPGTARPHHPRVAGGEQYRERRPVTMSGWRMGVR